MLNFNKVAHKIIVQLRAKGSGKKTTGYRSPALVFLSRLS